MSDLTVSVGRYPHTASLFGASIALSPGVTLTAQPGGGAADFRRMLRELAFDVCEVPVVNYLRARELAVPVIALPVFTTRRFPHGMLIWNTMAGVRAPSDLAGRRVGAPYHGNTDVVWVRGLLADEYGVDWASIEWVTSLEEPLEPHVTPRYVTQMLGVPLNEMLLTGQLAGLVEGRGQTIFDRSIAALAPDLASAERAWYERRGIFPVLFTVVVREDVLATHSGLAEDLLAVFAGAKADAYAARERAPLSEEALASANVSGFAADSAAAAERAYLGPDPLRYGLSHNQLAVSAVIRYAFEQQITAGQPDAEAVFLPLDEPSARPNNTMRGETCQY